jgi:hypothetical protein
MLSLCIHNGLKSFLLGDVRHILFFVVSQDIYGISEVLHYSIQDMGTFIMTSEFRVGKGKVFKIDFKMTLGKGVQSDHKKLDFVG